METFTFFCRLCKLRENNLEESGKDGRCSARGLGLAIC